MVFALFSQNVKILVWAGTACYDPRGWMYCIVASVLQGKSAGCYAVLHVLQSRARVKLRINVLPSPPPPTPPRSPGQDGDPGARGAARRGSLLHARLHPPDGRHAGAGKSLKKVHPKVRNHGEGPY